MNETANVIMGFAAAAPRLLLEEGKKTRRISRAFIEEKRRNEARKLKRELAEMRARMADAFFAMSEPYGGA